MIVELDSNVYQNLQIEKKCLLYDTMLCIVQYIKTCLFVTIKRK